MFLFDLTHHSWEPNLVEKTKFRIVLPDMKSEPFVYEICVIRAALVWACSTSEAEVHAAERWKSSPEPRQRVGTARPPRSSECSVSPALAKLPENDVTPCPLTEPCGSQIYRFLR